MIEAKDGILVKGAEQDPIEFPGRSLIAPERFFDNYARTVAAARFSKLLDDHCDPRLGCSPSARAARHHLSATAGRAQKD
jgi:hypothetical protein